jgi:PLP dependent protein
MSMISHNLQRVRAQIDAACAASGRSATEVALLAVSKTQSAQAVREAVAAGQHTFGENYIQEGVEKILNLHDLRATLQWHMIGPVQSNKTRLVAEHFDWVHTVDRLKIAERLSEQRPAHLPPLQVCIQVNVDAGANKSGVAVTETLALARAVAALPRMTLRGIMTIPEPAIDLIAAHAPFQRAKALFDQIKAVHIPGAAHWDTLSMGMSADLQAAIAEGSTLVRVGTAIFGARAV